MQRVKDLAHNWRGAPPGSWDARRLPYKEGGPMVTIKTRGEESILLAHKDLVEMLEAIEAVWRQ